MSDRLMTDSGSTSSRTESGFRGGVVVDLDLADRIDAIPPGPSVAALVVRLFSEPLGMVLVDVPPDGLDEHAVRTMALRHVEHEAAVRLTQVGLSLLCVRAGPVFPAASVPFLAARLRVLEAAPRITVVVCTRDHPGPLKRCLESLAIQDYPDYSVLVVDNAPSDSAAAQVVDQMSSVMDVRYVIEPVPGLSRARNRALENLGVTDLVAWLDDDETADVTWLAEVARAFHEHPEASAMSGVVVPAELRTVAQVRFEQFGGHSKGRGFSVQTFSRQTMTDEDPLYPLPPFGVGANMAFRPSALRAIGGFDPALGAGTPAKGAEDSYAFTRLLLDGHTVVYQGSALTRHFHRPDDEGLRAQLEGYGIGLTAFYTALAVNDPRLVWPLLKLAPRALKDLRSTDGPRLAGLPDDFPADVLSANRKGMVKGPYRYLRQRIRTTTPR